MSDSDNNNGDSAMKAGWHLDKKVPLSIILAVAMQTAVLIMWGARIEQRVTNNETVTSSHTVIIESMRGGQTNINVSLARMEERQIATAEGVKEIKVKLDAELRAGSRTK